MFWSCRGCNPTWEILIVSDYYKFDAPITEDKVKEIAEKDLKNVCEKHYNKFLKINEYNISNIEEWTDDEDREEGVQSFYIEAEIFCDFSELDLLPLKEFSNTFPKRLFTVLSNANWLNGKMPLFMLKVNFVNNECFFRGAGKTIRKEIGMFLKNIYGIDYTKDFIITDKRIYIDYSRKDEYSKREDIVKHRIYLD